MPRTTPSVPKRLTRTQIRSLNAREITPTYPFDRPLDPGETLATHTVEGVGTIKVIERPVIREGVLLMEPAEAVLDAILLAVVEGLSLSTIYDVSYRGELVGKIETPPTRAETEGRKVDYVDRGRASRIRVRRDAYMADLARRTENLEGLERYDRKASNSILRALGK